MWLALGSVVASLAASPEGPAGASLQSSYVAVLLLGSLAFDLVARHLADSFGSAGHDGESVIFAAVLLQAFVLVTLAPTPAWIAQALATFPGG